MFCMPMLLCVVSGPFPVAANDVIIPLYVFNPIILVIEQTLYERRSSMAVVVANISD